MSEIDQSQLAGLSQEDLVCKALTALHNGHSYLAMACLQQAALLGRSSIIDSHLGYCLALNGHDLTEAVQLGQAALRAEPNNPLFCLNLGRTLLLAGNEAEAVQVFRQGLSFSRDEELIAELDHLSCRKPALFPGLHRDHPLNKWGGKLLALIGLR